MTRTSERRDRRADRHAATKREILDAAWSLARERGLAGWALRDVAEAVGMRAPSLYVYFDSKYAVYDAMFADGYAELLARAASSSRRRSQGARRRGPRASGATMFVDFCVEDPARLQLLFLRTIPGFEPSEESYAARAERAGGDGPRAGRRPGLERRRSTLRPLDGAAHGSRRPSR